MYVFWYSSGSTTRSYGYAQPHSCVLMHVFALVLDGGKFLNLAQGNCVGSKCSGSLALCGRQTTNMLSAPDIDDDMYLYGCCRGYNSVTTTG